MPASRFLATKSRVFQELNDHSPWPDALELLDVMFLCDFSLIDPHSLTPFSTLPKPLGPHSKLQGEYLLIVWPLAVSQDPMMKEAMRDVLPWRFGAQLALLCTLGTDYLLFGCWLYSRKWIGRKEVQEHALRKPSSLQLFLSISWEPSML